ncbi:MAG: DUF5107 domain-containing protein [Candidatus Cryptobacteroides sp.]
MKRPATFLLFLAVCTALSAQTVTVKDTVMRTYGFSDPDPVPRTGRIYPYHRYQTFAREGEDQVWKMVVLENDFLRVRIFPQIGGKIWSVYDKKASRELFYDNGVVKFRDISLRGPWTSGGIEFNYGIIGHAPSCSSPVDYRVEKKADESVSCYIGVQELLTRTRWMVEINLPKDAVWLRTRTFWHNYSGLPQPYYHWANSGVTASEDLNLVYPATYSIGHDGRTSPYPYDQGHDLSKYSDQKFGRDKSLHPGGSHKGYFGAYWEDGDYGMLHYARRDEKPGRKYFTWAPSGEGSIWVGLLTDDNPQYVELQSGRLFNQNMVSSNDTPFKQFVFTPYGTDEWSEYWLPFSGIGGVDDMTLKAVVNLVCTEEGDMRLGIYPLRKLSGRLEVRDADGNGIYSETVTLEPGEPFNRTAAVGSAPAAVLLGGARLWSSDTRETDRPHQIDSAFDKTSAEGLEVYARCYLGMGAYAAAEALADSALVRNPSAMGALNLKAGLRYRAMDWEEAYRLCNRVLSIDTYDPQANYTGGLAAWKLGKVYDALDRLEIAALTPELRSAAQTRLAQFHFALGDREAATEYAAKSLVGNAWNMTALQLLYQCCHDSEILARIRSLDPLSHFPDAELCLAGQLEPERLDSCIFEEMKWQNYLELASWYHGIGLDGKATAILDACLEDNVLLSVWKAWLRKDSAALEAAKGQPLDLVFPFRSESYEPLKWAVEEDGGWQFRYLLAMLADFLGNSDSARELLHGDESGFAPYYSYRYTLTRDVEDARKACALDPEEWRYVRDLALDLCGRGEVSGAEAVVAPYYAAHRDNVHIADTYARVLMALKQYRKADKVIASMQVLPFEGQSATHSMYRTVKLELAREALSRKQYRKALEYVAQARLWPVHLGVGKPYDYLIDTSEEDALEAEIKSAMGGK